jgi:TRAP-type C4-dicarboxylate transport system permease large subunit
MMPLVFVAMAGLLALGVPIAFTLGLASAIFYVLAPGVTPAFLVQRMVASTESFPLLAVPFFIFAGAVMTRGGISQRIIGLADALVGHRIGGLAQVNVLNSVCIGGTVCAIVGLSIEELTREVGPFLLALIIVLFVVTYVPPTVLWLPNLMMGK